MFQHNPAEPSQERDGLSANNQPVKKNSPQTRMKEFGIKSPSGGGKNFVLDTSVLLHDPACLNRFTDNHICIPVDVLAELDRFKGEQTERGANARQVHRKLTEIFAQDETNDKAVTAGVPTDGGGTVRLIIYDPDFCEKNSAELGQFLRIFPDCELVDHRILATALLLMKHNDNSVILVTKDLNMQLKARSVGIKCEDYLNDKVDAVEISSCDLKCVDVDAMELQHFASSGEIIIEQPRRVGLVLNQYVLLKAGDKQTMPARLDTNGTFVKLQIPEALRIPYGNHLKPLNLGQRCLIDALLNPDISLVTVYGQAGTGKTLVAVAVGLHEMANRRYNGLTVSRPVVAMGDQLGSLEDKMRPWLQPIYDALDLLMQPTTLQRPSRNQQKKEEGESAVSRPYDELIERGVLEIEALSYIRGRSIPNRFFILDEAQQLTPQEAKAIVTRMSRGSKLVLVGDPTQIDNPYVDSRSNGLAYTRNRLKGQSFTAHVTLSSGERGPLAEAGEQLM